MCRSKSPPPRQRIRSIKFPCLKVTAALLLLPRSCEHAAGVYAVLLQARGPCGCVEPQLIWMMDDRPMVFVTELSLTRYTPHSSKRLMMGPPTHMGMCVFVSAANSALLEHSILYSGVDGKLSKCLCFRHLGPEQSFS